MNKFTGEIITIQNIKHAGKELLIIFVDGAYAGLREHMAGMGWKMGGWVYTEAKCISTERTKITYRKESCPAVRTIN